jgi:hypothetical protein
MFKRMNRVLTRPKHSFLVASEGTWHEVCFYQMHVHHLRLDVWRAQVYTIRQKRERAPVLSDLYLLLEVMKIVEICNL